MEDIAYKLQELFSLVGAVDESYQVHYFTQAIDPEIAYRMEESGVATSWADAINKTVRIENARKKYMSVQSGCLTSVPLASSMGRDGQLVQSSVVPSSTGVSLAPQDSVSQTHTLLTQVADSLRALQLQMASQGSRPSPPNNPPRPPLTCWNCGQEGHISSRCSLPPQPVPQGHHRQNQGNGEGRQ